MSVKLKVLHGALKKRGKWQVVVPIKRSPFVIGQAEDCDMRCFGKAINEYHCEVRIDSTGVFVRGLSPASETFVNGGKVAGLRPFFDGDQLRIGKLAFELVLDLPSASNGEDAFDAFVSQMLQDADEVDREQRIDSLEHRWYKIEPNQTEKRDEQTDPYAGLTAKERLIAKARKKIPVQQGQPAKLPVTSGRPRQSLEASIETYYQDLKNQLRS